VELEVHVRRVVDAARRPEPCEQVTVQVDVTRRGLVIRAGGEYDRGVRAAVVAAVLALAGCSSGTTTVVVTETVPTPPPTTSGNVGSCVVYAAGRTVQVLMRGPDASAQCAEFVALRRGIGEYSWSTDPSVAGEPAPDAPDYFVVCDVSNGTLRITVTDTGLGRVGEGVCTPLYRNGWR
jgi:hypothetical protein